MSTLQQVNVGVIGVGWFGHFHAQIYDYLAAANLLGVYDIDQERTRTVAAEFGVKPFASLETLLADEAIDAVSICVKDQHHLEPTLAAARAGKHIMLEKPMALTLEECDQMIDAAEEAEVKLMVGHLLRFNQRNATAHHKIASGEIGSVSHFYTRRNMPRSAPRHVGDCCGYHTMIFHGAVHEYDLMQWMADDEIVEAYAVYKGGEMEAEGCPVSDTILSLLTFRKGAAAITEHSWIYPDNFPAMVDGRAEITGTHGRIELDMGFRGGISYTESGVHFFENPHWPVVEGRLSSDLRDELEGFLHAVRNDRPVPVTGRDGRRAVAAALAVIKSLESGRPETVDGL